MDEFDVMIDIEGFNNRPNTAILEVGAVTFCPRTGVTFSELELVIKVQDCIDAGLGVSADTIFWWMEQNREARQALIRNQRSEKALPLRKALAALTRWFNEEAKGHRYVWAHHTTYDLAAINNAYDRILGQGVPWDFRKEQDTATMFPHVAGKKMSQLVERVGVHHSALDDARTQAKAVANAYAEKELNHARTQKPAD